ncbi:iron-containing alcohol dehydrogenase family protein [Thermopetrobacter sp. TC1]|uniref:iron-containing alcohol dehydrogenase family protein n=1 Tax=Thermopetrobacter sp. TC1 TaxID=1495045 RepID=UPI0018CE65DB|nr:iron-containing alcohol dehydrogenase [Thermopetrobacter sp. TC1]
MSDQHEDRMRAGARKILPGVCADLDVEEVLFFTDAHLAAAPEVAGLVGALAVEGLGVHVQAVPAGLPSPKAAEALADAVRERKADGIVALGGGAVMDLARMAALLAPHEEKRAEDFALGVDSSSSQEIARGQESLAEDGAQVPVIALPTTLAGAETSAFAFLVDAENQRRLVIRNEGLVADAVLLDPELARGLPLELFKANMLLAQAHLLEAALAGTDENQRQEACSLLEGLRALLKALAETEEITQSQILEAMKLAGLAGGLSERQFGGLHALAAQLSLRHRGHYGTMLAILLPSYLARLAEAPLPAGVTADDAMSLQATAEEIARLRERFGLPARLADVGVNEAELPEIATHAAADPLMRSSPWPMDEEILSQILRTAA